MINSAVEEALGEIPDGKTVKEYIEELTQSAAYDDTQIKADIKDIKDAVDVLNGTGEGSVDKKVADAVAAIVAGAPEAYDTLKEISDWISTHADSASAMNSAINDNKQAIEDLVALVGELPEGEEATTIIEYIQSKVTDLDWSEDITNALATAATDATQKANKALEDAKEYVDTALSWGEF